MSEALPNVAIDASEHQGDHDEVGLSPVGAGVGTTWSKESATISNDSGALPEVSATSELPPAFSKDAAPEPRKPSGNISDSGNWAAEAAGFAEQLTS